MDETLQIHQLANGVSLPVQVQPRAGPNKIRGVHDGRLKLAIAAAPVDGEATAQCLRVLADIFSVSNSQVKLLSGAQSRKKLFLIEGVSLEYCHRILAAHLQKG